VVAGHVCRFIALEQLRFGKNDSLRVLISSEVAYFLGRGGTESDPDNIVLQVPYQELFHCRAIPNGLILKNLVLYYFN
jgi:hypothetical protein